MEKDTLCIFDIVLVINSDTEMCFVLYGDETPKRASFSFFNITLENVSLDLGRLRYVAVIITSRA